MPAQSDPFLAAIQNSRLLDPAKFAEIAQWTAVSDADPQKLAQELTRRGWLTPFQVREIYKGNGKDMILGPYVLFDLVGEGGMGRVYKAHHTRLGREVALKVIRSDKLAKPAVLERFQTEIRAVAQLSHPNVVLALDAGESNGTHFYAMEYVEGTDLTKLVRSRGPIPMPLACDYIRQAAMGLQHAAERGLVHRDVKPSNLLVTPRGEVKVLDLGLAMLKDAPTGEATNRVTQDGLLIGTPDFLAPEQAQNPSGVDTRADVYSLGATLFYILTGKVPYEGASATDKLLQHITAPPPSILQHLPEAPPHLDAIIRWMMGKRPEERPPTPAHAAAALVPFCPPPPGYAPPPWGQPAPVPYPQPVPAPYPQPAPMPVPQAAPMAFDAQPAATVSLPPAAVPTYPAAPQQFAPQPFTPQQYAPQPVMMAAPVAAPQAEPVEIREPAPRSRSYRDAEPKRGNYKKSSGNVAFIATFLMLGALLVCGGGAAFFLIPLILPKEDPPPTEDFVNSMNMTMVLLPGGTFQMGSPEDEIGHVKDEAPQSEVTVSGPFFIASTEVSHGTYTAMMGRSPSKLATKARNPAKHPVDSVTWEEANDFCRKLTEKEKFNRKGWGYRLPTEAEWEYACRCDKSTPFSFGERVLQLKQVVCTMSPNDPYADTDPEFSEVEQRNVLVSYPVGSTEANAWKLHDMHGNVWEWCSDYYERYPPEGPRIDPKGPEKGDWRVVRGGAWDMISVRCRSAARMGIPSNGPEGRRTNVGFRVVYAKLPTQ